MSRRRRSLREHARRTKIIARAAFAAWFDAQTPWYARALAVLVVAYAVSPVDLIPDFIPLLGYLDDLVILPIGVALVMRLVPPPVRVRSLRRAVRGKIDVPTVLRVAGVALVVVVWMFIAYAIVTAVLRGAGR